MAPKKISIKLQQEIQTNSAAVFDAFTNAASLAEWLCDYAQSAPVTGGSYHLFWNNGYYAYGEYISIVAGKSFLSTWQGKDEPGTTALKITLKEKDGLTKLTLTHSSIVAGKGWKKLFKNFRTEWEHSLQNLKSVLETGRDLRLVRRPILGISSAAELTPELAAQANAPVERGIQIGGVSEDHGAFAAGLAQGDIIVKIAGQRVENFTDLASALNGYQAGDSVKVIFFRGSNKNSTKLELSERPLLDVPLSAAELAEAISNNHTLLDLELVQALEGITEPAASFKPEPSTWSINEILAHLIGTERDIQNWILDLLENRPIQVVYHNNLPEQIQATISAYPQTNDLLEELKRNEKQTAALVASLSADFQARKGSMWRLGLNLLSVPDHTREHIQEILALRESHQQETTSTKRAKKTSVKKKSPPTDAGEAKPEETLLVEDSTSEPITSE